MDHIHTFLTTQGHGGPPLMSDQPYAGATSEIAQTWKTIHTKHTLSHPNKANMEWWLRRPNDIRGTLGGLKFPDICLTGEEKPRKNLTQEPVPTGDRTRARCVTIAHVTTCSTAVDLIIICLLICVFTRNSHNKYNTCLCFSLDKITHDFVFHDFSVKPQVLLYYCW